jgi:hypothetical protein
MVTYRVFNLLTASLTLFLIDSHQKDLKHSFRYHN